MGAGEKLRPQNLAGAGAERDGKCCVQVTPPNKSGCEWPRRARVRPVSKRRRRMHGRRRRGRKRGRRGGGRVARTDFPGADVANADVAGADVARRGCRGRGRRETRQYAERPGRSRERR
jgi:hypothetical protein